MIYMKTAIRSALYVLSTKQGRDTVVKVIAGIITAIAFLMIFLQGLFGTYFSVFAGSDDDNYSIAVEQVKQELQIENDLKASILRAVNYKLTGTVEAETVDIKNMITTYFINTVSNERTVKLEDIENQQKLIDDMTLQLSIEQSKPNVSVDVINQWNEQILAQTEILNQMNEVYAAERDYTYSFKTLDEIKIMLAAPPFSFEESFIEEIEKFTIFQQSADIDFSNISFSNETANDTQKQIAAVAQSASDYGIYASEGKCQKWVADIYQKVLGKRGHAESAVAAGREWSVSSDWASIQIGATVYGTASNQYGHVGIYIGNGNVIHNLDGYVKMQSLESWVKSYNGRCWGWENGQNLTGNSEYDCIGGLI